MRYISFLEKPSTLVSQIFGPVKHPQVYTFLTVYQLSLLVSTMSVSVNLYLVGDDPSKPRSIIVDPMMTMKTFKDNVGKAFQVLNPAGQKPFSAKPNQVECVHLC